VDGDEENTEGKGRKKERGGARKIVISYAIFVSTVARHTISYCYTLIYVGFKIFCFNCHDWIS